MQYLISIGVFLMALVSVSAKTWSDLCAFEMIPDPKGVDPQVGALGVLPSGDLIAAFHRGEIMKYSLSQRAWSHWGGGLHEPLGMHVENEHSVVVVQRSELTRIVDMDKDGIADVYEVIASDWGMSGNYHEFAFGAAKAPDGSFFIGLGTASNGGGVRPEIRGLWKVVEGLTHAKTMPSWEKSGRNFPRMYARVPYRGWVIKVDSKTGKVTPYASGLRTPHGVHVNPQGEVYVNDNQGDWLGSSKLYKIEQGKFYGHPDSLIWTDGWDRGVPANLQAEKLDELRTKSLCYLPQGDLANSPTQILTLPKEGFGPYGGDLIMGEMNQPRLVRYLPDVVNGVEQGAVIGFLEHPNLGRGNAKFALGEQGTLYIGKTQLSWAGGRGLIAFKYKDVPHLAIESVQLTSSGFKVMLNAPVDETSITMTGQRYGYHYHKKYGSPKVNKTDIKASVLKVRGKVLEIVLSESLIPGQVYDVSLAGVTSGNLGSLVDCRFFYTAHEVSGK